MQLPGIVLFCFVILFAQATTVAASSARLTRLTKGVKVARASESHPAVLNETIANGSMIETGAGAQAELRLDTGTIVRLGQNSVLDLRDLHRMTLRRGAMLVLAPKGSDAQVATGNVISVVSGTTSLLEHYPEAYIKLISREGTSRMFMPSVVGESVLVKAGQLLMFHTKPAPTGLPNPVDIDINRLLTTSQLIKGFAPLGSESSIAEGARDQKQQKSKGALADTNLVIFGRGTLVSLVPPAAEATPPPSPSPTPRRR
ncbi:MAG: hypothetical protein DLM73_04130 [Chthoniobacterales bacterium]|nr:MAG: hypothetical protein DLM73_04130 [Chthoniobacterales bacterium]